MFLPLPCISEYQDDFHEYTKECAVVYLGITSRSPNSIKLPAIYTKAISNFHGTLTMLAGQSCSIKYFRRCSVESSLIASCRSISLSSVIGRSLTTM